MMNREPTRSVETDIRDDAPQTDTAGRRLWGCARFIVAFFGLALLAMGGGAVYAVWIGMGWWMLVFVALGTGGGAWFLWVALRGSRGSVDSIVTEGLFKALDHFV